MFLRPVSSLCLQAKQGDNLICSLKGFPVTSSSSSSALSFPSRKHGRALGVYASIGTDNHALTGVVFQPFEEVKKEELVIPVDPQVSLARQKYADACEAAINEQIK